MAVSVEKTLQRAQQQQTSEENPIWTHDPGAPESFEARLQNCPVGKT